MQDGIIQIVIIKLERNKHNVGVIMMEYYWETIVQHRHDIMIPVLIIYLIVDKFIDRWFWINWFRKEFKQ